MIRSTSFFVILLLFLALLIGKGGMTASADSETDTEDPYAPQEEVIIDLDSMDIPDEPDAPVDIPVSAESLTPEQKAQIKAWLSAHGYPPTRAGAEAAYQDYLAGKFDNDPEVMAAVGRKVVSEETFIMDSASAWEMGADRRNNTESVTEAETTEEPTTEEATTEEVTTEEVTTEAQVAEEPKAESEKEKKERKILRDKKRNHRILVIGIGAGCALLVAGLIILELKVIGKKDEDDPEDSDEVRTEDSDRQKAEEKEEKKKS